MENKIVAIGSIAIDELHTSKGFRSNVLGGSATFFSIAAAQYNPVNLIGIVGNDFPQTGWNLFEKYNINTDLVTIKDGKTFSWGGKYSKDYSTRETLYTNLGVFENYLTTILFIRNICAHSDLLFDSHTQFLSINYHIFFV